jgi:hypothetical protein
MIWPRVDFHNSDCDIFIARPSKWGNPFVIGVDGTREEVIELYEVWLRNKPKLLQDARRELAGKVLGCYCTHGIPCHGDVLVRVANSWELAIPLEI